MGGGKKFNLRPFIGARASAHGSRLYLMIREYILLFEGLKDFYKSWYLTVRSTYRCVYNFQYKVSLK